MSASFVFEFETYCVNGYAGPGEREHGPQPLAAEAQPDEEEAEQREQVERDRGEVRRWQVVPLPGPTRGSRSPGCTTRMRPARTCRPRDSRSRSGRSTGSSRGSRPEESAVPQDFFVFSTGKLPHGACAVDDPLGADHARVADVDHVRALDVEPDPEAGQEDRRRRAAPRPASAARPGCRGCGSRSTSRAAPPTAAADRRAAPP